LIEAVTDDAPIVEVGPAIVLPLDLTKVVADSAEAKAPLIEEVTAILSPPGLPTSIEDQVPLVVEEAPATVPPPALIEAMANDAPIVEVGPADVAPQDLLGSEVEEHILYVINLPQDVIEALRAATFVYREDPNSPIVALAPTAGPSGIAAPPTEGPLGSDDSADLTYNATRSSISESSSDEADRRPKPPKRAKPYVGKSESTFLLRPCSGPPVSECSKPKRKRVTKVPVDKQKCPVDNCDVFFSSSRSAHRHIRNLHKLPRNLELIKNF
jgi:hypothetical protein